MKKTIINIGEATFDCTYGRGCEGLCCRNGRPPVYADEMERIDTNLSRLLPELRPEARAVVEREGYVSRRRKAGELAMRVAAGWCVFFNNGCVLHRFGAEKGDSRRYKPWVCSTFPIANHGSDRWYVRQKGFLGEIWDLPCLDPAATKVRAAESLREEIAMVERLEESQ